MAAVLPVVAALGACAAPGNPGQGLLVPAGIAGPVALRVTNAGQPFGMDQGAAARKVAEGLCAAEGRVLRTSIYDRFEAGAWVYREGCQ